MPPVRFCPGSDAAAPCTLVGLFMALLSQLPVKCPRLGVAGVLVLLTFVLAVRMPPWLGVCPSPKGPNE